MPKETTCKGKWFFDHDTYPALGCLIADWPHLINFRLNVLRPSSALPAHEEHIPFRTQAGTVGARLRFHLPIQTNDEAELHLDGLVYQLKTGIIYLVNQGCVHAAQNRGSQTRAHLVWDSLLTEELFTFLFQSHHIPPCLSVIIDREEKLLRTEATRPYRRLPPPLSAAEAAALSFCHPQ